MIESLVRAVAATFLLLMAMALLVYAGIIILITRNKIQSEIIDGENNERK